MNALNNNKYKFTCTLTLGDIYAQVVAWLVVVFASLASALSLMSKPIYSLASVGIIIVVSLPFLLFGFVTTLFNHIEISPITEVEKSTNQSRSTANRDSNKTSAATT
jgi:fatty acid desaturase